MKLLMILILLFSASVASKLEVTTSIMPQKYFIEQIAKDKVIVNVMVKTGFSPAMYEPKTSQMKKLMTSKIYFSIGVGFEDIWLDKFSNINKNMMIVDTSKGIEKSKIQNHEHHNEKHEDNKNENNKNEKNHHENGLDPHIWLDPILVKVQTKNILDALIILDKKNKNFYEKNYKIFVNKLDTLTLEINKLLIDVKHKPFMVFHPSWGYFAARFNLKQMAVEKEGKEPKPRELVDLIHEAKEHNIKIIFVAPQFSQRAAKTIASSIKGTVLKIDPLSIDYMNNLLHTARKIKESYSLKVRN